MTDQTTVESPGTVPVSTTINDGTIPQESGGGIKGSDLAHDKPEPAKKPESVRDTLEAVRKDIGKDEKSAEQADQKAEKADAEKDEATKDEAETEKAKAEKLKAEPEAKKAEPAKAEEGAAEKPAAGRDGDEGRQSEGRKHSEPPARFLPEARTKWANVPNEVKAEVHRVAKEYENELTESRQIRERYEPIRQYDEIAKANGRTLGDSLQKVVEIEQALARNPISGLDMILREVGPRKADGSPMSIMDVAQFVAQQSPQQMQAIMQQGQQTQRQPDPEVAQLRQQMQSMQMQMASTSIMPVIDQFGEQYPDFYDLQEAIADELKSGLIEKKYGPGLSPQQKLMEAYRRAGGQMTPSHSDTVDHPEPPAARPVTPDAGTKSVRGAPNGGEEPKFERPAQSTRDLLREEMRKMSRS